MHEKHGLLGPKFTAGHGVWLSNDEFRRFSHAGAAVCFCPLSNLFLGSGLFRLGKAMDPDQPVRVCLGTDMGAGNSFSMIHPLLKLLIVSEPIIRNFALKCISKFFSSWFRHHYSTPLSLL